MVLRHADNKPNSTLAKLDRWETYVTGLADVAARRTWYSQRYPDSYAPEVIFLVPSDRRAKTVNGAIDEWRRKTVGAELEVRALTLPAMLAELGVASAAPGSAQSREGRVSNSWVASRGVAPTGGPLGWA